MVADGYEPIGEEFAILANFLSAFNLNAKADTIHQEGGNPSSKIYEGMPYFELWRFVKIGVGFVKLYVLGLSTNGGHPHERIVARKIRCRFRNIDFLPDLEVAVCWTK